MSKKSRKVEAARREALASEPIRSLIEMFAVVDDVFTTEDAFEPEYIHKSLGRCYRQWKATRLVLDPDFNPKRYPKKQRKKKKPKVGEMKKVTFATKPRK